MTQPVKDKPKVQVVGTWTPEQRARIQAVVEAVAKRIQTEVKK